MNSATSTVKDPLVLAEFETRWLLANTQAIPRSEPLYFTLLTAATARRVPETHDIALCCGALADPAPARWRARLFAAWLLGRAPIPAAARKRAVHILIASAKELPALAYASDGYLRASAVSFILSIPVLFGLASSPAAMVGALAGIWGLGWFLLAPSYVASDRDGRLNLRVMAVGALGKIADVDGLEVSAAAATSAWPDLRAAGRRALTAIVPNLSPSDYGKIGRDAVPALCRLLEDVPAISMHLGYSEDRTIALTTLDALACIGDGRAVAAVTRLAHRDASVYHATSPWRLACERAREVLPILQQRAEKERDPMRLLHPASSPVETLLRPAHAGDDQNQSSLLRPSDRER